MGAKPDMRRVLYDAMLSLDAGDREDLIELLEKSRWECVDRARDAVTDRDERIQSERSVRLERAVDALIGMEL